MCGPQKARAVDTVLLSLAGDTVKTLTLKTIAMLVRESSQELRQVGEQTIRNRVARMCVFHNWTKAQDPACKTQDIYTIPVRPFNIHHLTKEQIIAQLLEEGVNVVLLLSRRRG